MNDKQARFCEEFLKDLNATQSAIRAGYSEDTAHSQGARLMRDVQVKAKIHRAMKRRSERTAITADRVLHEYAKIAFSDLRNLVSWGKDGVELLDSDELAAEDAATVAEITATDTREGKRIKVKQWSKLRALELLSRHLGLFEPSPESDPYEMARRIRLLVQQGYERTGGRPADDQEEESDD